MCVYVCMCITEDSWSLEDNWQDPTVWITRLDFRSSGLVATSLSHLTSLMPFAGTEVFNVLILFFKFYFLSLSGF